MRARHITARAARGHTRDRSVGDDTFRAPDSPQKPQRWTEHPAENALDCLAFLFATVCDDGRRARGGDRDAVR
eukprot:SAG31_NODE_27496_length_425_cov_0.871166_1_plen_72_part_01